jgi:hypothetical protein
VTKISSNSVAVAADYTPIGVSNYTVQLYNGTNYMGGETGLAPGTMCYISRDPQVDNPGGVLPTDTVRFPGQRPLSWTEGVSASFSIGGAGLLIDHLVISSPAMRETNIPTALLFRASQIPSIVVTNEFVLPLTLNSTVTDTNLQLQWFGTGVLQNSQDLKSWTDLINAASPCVVPNGPSNQFYRIRQPVRNEISE